MAVDGAAIGMATLSLTQGFTQFNAFLPPLSEVRRATPGSDTYADVRVGELAAAVGTIAVGAIVSSLSGSPVPAYVAVLTAVFLITLYESVLKADPNIAKESAL